MSNHNINLGNRAQQQIAGIAAALGAIAGGMATHSSDGNPLIGAAIIGALCFVLGLWDRWIGITICIISAIVIYGQLSGS